jgi:acyl-CoA thioesterase-1|tara:strand:+ start:3454 stop:4047 length:594 start_codon:yes stop_codon:yes gene_type:complete
MRISKLLVMLFLLSANSYASTFLIVGDSLSAGYGINPDNGWVNLLRMDLEPEHQIINASISGDTTGNGLARLPVLLEKFKPEYVLLELGGNDGLRGHPLSRVKANLQTMIDLCREQNAQPILFAMRLPPNYGKRYTDTFASLFPTLAQEQNLPLVPFQFEKLVLTEGMIQQDGIHPTELAQPTIKQAVLVELKKLLK